MIAKLVPTVKVIPSCITEFTSLSAIIQCMYALRYNVTYLLCMQVHTQQADFIKSFLRCLV